MFSISPASRRPRSGSSSPASRAIRRDEFFACGDGEGEGAGGPAAAAAVAERTSRTAATGSSCPGRLRRRDARGRRTDNRCRGERWPDVNVMDGFPYFFFSGSVSTKCWRIRRAMARPPHCRAFLPAMFSDRSAARVVTRSAIATLPLLRSTVDFRPGRATDDVADAGGKLAEASPAMSTRPWPARGQLFTSSAVQASGETGQLVLRMSWTVKPTRPASS